MIRRYDDAQRPQSEEFPQVSGIFTLRLIAAPGGGKHEFQNKESRSYLSEIYQDQLTNNTQIQGMVCEPVVLGAQQDPA